LLFQPGRTWFRVWRCREHRSRDVMGNVHGYHPAFRGRIHPYLRQKERLEDRITRARQLARWRSKGKRAESGVTWGGITILAGWGFPDRKRTFFSNRGIARLKEWN